MNIPKLGPLTPQRGNVLTRAIGRVLLAAYRWQVIGKMHNAPKLILILAPHTSLWDLYTPNATMMAVGFRSSWLVAAVLSFWPLSLFIRWSDGIIVHRSSSHNLVSQIVKEFNDNDSLVLTLSPEGKLSKVIKWKTGFWHIASQAGVPIQLVSLDYGKRATEFGPVIETSDSIEADMERIQNYYKDVLGRNPNQFGGEYL